MPAEKPEKLIGRRDPNFKIKRFDRQIAETSL
jgi:hypothetical protein